MSRCVICDFSTTTPSIYNSSTTEEKISDTIYSKNGESICGSCLLAIAEANDDQATINLIKE